MTVTSRLGEAVSPERDPSSLKTQKSSPGREVALNTRNPNTISLRRTSLAWVRVCVAQTPSSSPERGAQVATKYATLLISPGRAKLAWARNADYFTDHARDSLQPCSIRTTKHTNQNSIIRKTIYAICNITLA